MLLMNTLFILKNDVKAALKPIGRKSTWDININRYLLIELYQITETDYQNLNKNFTTTSYRVETSIYIPILKTGSQHWSQEPFCLGPVISYGE